MNLETLTTDELQKLIEDAKAELSRRQEGEKKPEKVQLSFEFGDYNPRRYSKPWGAVVRFEGAKPRYDFKAGAFLGDSDNGGTLYVDCHHGDIIAIGRKDNRGGNTMNRWYIVQEDGSTTEVSQAEALEHWKK